MVCCPMTVLCMCHQVHCNLDASSVVTPDCFGVGVHLEDRNQGHGRKTWRTLLEDAAATRACSKKKLAEHGASSGTTFKSNCCQLQMAHKQVNGKFSIPRMAMAGKGKVASKCRLQVDCLDANRAKMERTHFKFAHAPVHFLPRQRLWHW